MNDPWAYVARNIETIYANTSPAAKTIRAIWWQINQGGMTDPLLNELKTAVEAYLKSAVS